MRILTLILLFSHSLFAQNLVPNPSFETVTAEPFYGCELNYATGWINPSGGVCPSNSSATPDLFSTLSTGQAILPNSFMGFTNPHTGNRCSGIVTYHAQIVNYREYLMAKLNCALVPGQEYSVSYWTTSSSPPQYIYNTNNIGVYFSMTSLSQSGFNVATNITPQLVENSIIQNTNWTKYTYTFIPTQAFEYISIGNFSTDQNTLIQSTGTNRPYAYYFFDDISVEQLKTPFLGPDRVLCNNSTLTLNSGNTNTNWSNGQTGSQITVSSPGSYVATITTNCGTLTDTIEVSLLEVDCNLSIPNAFTPNGDGKNDVFKPISACQTNSYWMRVYNRWGGLVFETNDIDKGWDGSLTNNNQPVGTFIYYVQYFNDCSNSIQKKTGEVTLLR